MNEHKEASSVEDTEARSAMKLALEALNVAEHFVEEYAASKYYFAHIVAKTSLEEALALKQEQRNVSEQLGEPFGWYDMEHGEIRDVEWTRQKPIYEGVWKPLYTTPQQPSTIVRTWVGLTDEDWTYLEKNCGSIRSAIKTAEAKLKDKNNG